MDIGWPLSDGPGKVRVNGIRSLRMTPRGSHSTESALTFSWNAVEPSLRHLGIFWVCKVHIGNSEGTSTTVILMKVSTTVGFDPNEERTKPWS
jgi:hypothetical protein